MDIDRHKSDRISREDVVGAKKQVESSVVCVCVCWGEGKEEKRDRKTRYNFSKDHVARNTNEKGKNISNNKPNFEHGQETFPLTHPFTQGFIEGIEEHNERMSC